MYRCYIIKTLSAYDHTPFINSDLQRIQYPGHKLCMLLSPCFKFSNILCVFVKTDQKTRTDSGAGPETGLPLLENSPQNGKKVNVKN